MIKLKYFFKAIILVLIPILFLMHGLMQISYQTSVKANIKRIIAGYDQYKNHNGGVK